MELRVLIECSKRRLLAVVPGDRQKLAFAELMLDYSAHAPQTAKGLFFSRKICLDYLFSFFTFMIIEEVQGHALKKPITTDTSLQIRQSCRFDVKSICSSLAGEALFSAGVHLFHWVLQQEK
jgi:hypothetical protein